MRGRSCLLAILTLSLSNTSCSMPTQTQQETSVIDSLCVVTRAEHYRVTGKKERGRGGNEKWCTGVLGKGKEQASIDAMRSEALEAQHSLIKEVKDGLES